MMQDNDRNRDGHDVWYESHAESGTKTRESLHPPVSKIVHHSNADHRKHPALMEETIIINVGGTLHEVFVSVLHRIPGTRLAKLASRLTSDESYRVDNNDYFFDRNGSIFGDILDYYRAGELHIKRGACHRAFSKELEYWGLSPTDISFCCWLRYYESESIDHMNHGLDKILNPDPFMGRDHHQLSRWERICLHSWNVFENPKSSKLAKLVLGVTVLMTTASIFAFVAETHYVFQQQRLPNGTLIPAPAPHKSAACKCASQFELNSTKNESAATLENVDIDAHPALHCITYITFCYFLIEVALRILLAPSKVAFFKESLNICELVAIVAQAISITTHTLAHDVTHVPPSFYTLLLLKSLSIIRMGRIFKLFQHNQGFRVLIHTVSVSMPDILLIVSFLLAGALVAASIMHYSESETFPSIPDSMWWSLVTMATVGYGDIVPTTPMGYTVGSATVIAGVLVMAFTVPVVVNNFTLHYSLLKSRNSRASMIAGRRTAQNTTKVLPALADKSFKIIDAPA